MFSKEKFRETLICDCQHQFKLNINLAVTFYIYFISASQSFAMMFFYFLTVNAKLYQVDELSKMADGVVSIL